VADHRGGQLRLGRERRSVGNARGGTPVRVVGPRPGQVQGAVNERVTAVGGVGEVDGDLGILDAAGGAGVLALHPDRVGALLQIPGLINLCGCPHRWIYADTATMPRNWQAPVRGVLAESALSGLARD
jgi:hypothetical protein